MANVTNTTLFPTMGSEHPNLACKEPNEWLLILSAWGVASPLTIGMITFISLFALLVYQAIHERSKIEGRLDILENLESLFSLDERTVVAIQDPEKGYGTAYSWRHTDPLSKQIRLMLQLEKYQHGYWDYKVSVRGGFFPTLERFRCWIFGIEYRDDARERIRKERLAFKNTQNGPDLENMERRIGWEAGFHLYWPSCSHS